MGDHEYELEKYLLSGKLSDEELQLLFQAKNEGNPQAREILVLSHLRLVKSVAARNSGRGVPYEDLYQEGCYGLLCAVDLYQCHKNVSFHSFAWNYINKYIQKALIQQKTNSTFQLSEEYYYKLRRYRQLYFELSTTLGRPPNHQELAEALGTSVALVRKLNSLLFHSISLDDTYASCKTSEYSGRPNYEVISSTPDIKRPTEDAALSLLKGQEEILQRTLTDIERDIICSRIGVTPSGSPETIPSIAARLNISYETVRRAFNRGIQKLRNELEVEPIVQKKAGDFP